MNKELVNELNSYLSSLTIEYTKLHNFHWNVVGSNFKAVHEFLEKLYNEIADIIDETAELLKINDETPLGTVKEYLSNSKINEITSQQIDIQPALRIVLDDFNILKSIALKIREYAEDDNFTITNTMEDNIKSFDKTIWFICSTLK